jgi:hypothetical protein
MNSHLLDDKFEEYLEKREKYYSTFLGKIHKWYWDSIGWRLRELKRSITSVIRWLPVIWKDRDYGSNYLFTILKTKIEFLAKEHESSKFYVGWEKNVKLMRLCIKLINIIEEEEFVNQAHSFIDNKYGKSTWKFIPIPNKPGLNELKIEHENILNGLYTQQQYDVEFRDMLDIAYKKQDKASKLLFKILHEHGQNWWI